MGELREVEAQLMEGSAWVERLRRGGSTATSSSPAFEQSSGSVMGSGVVELAKGRGEWIAGVFVVLLRTRGESGGLCLGRATATARWRPADARCCVARQGRHSAKAKSGGGGQARRVGRQREQEVAGLALHSGDGAEQRRRGAEQVGRLEVEESGPICNFRNFRDLTIN